MKRKLFFGFGLLVVILTIMYLMFTPMGKQLLRPVPQKAIYESYRDVNGEIFRMRALVGKPFVLVFFIDDCPICDGELPKWNRYYGKADSSKISIIGVLWADKAKAKSIVERKKISFPVLLDEKRKIAKKYGVVAYPSVILVNKKGKVKDVIDYDRAQLELEKYAR